LDACKIGVAHHLADPIPRLIYLKYRSLPINRKTASVLDAVEHGETFELRRNGRAVGYITRAPPSPERKPDWKSHFDWLRKQAKEADAATLAEFEQERRRQAAREQELGNLVRMGQ
jgi:antitoxin (DNA-binding transcriptional repressor) of toxin-antitoxin stability system